MYCQKCGKEIPDGSTFCPECGATQGVQPTPGAGATPVQSSMTSVNASAQKPKKKTALWIVLGILAVIIIAAAIGGGKNDSGSTGTGTGTSAQTETSDAATSETPQNSWDGKFNVTDLASTTDQFGYMHITGTVTNLKNKEYSYIQVEINLYDDSGAQIDSTLANANNLEANGTWKFEAIAMTTGVASYKLKDITAY